MRRTDARPPTRARTTSPSTLTRPRCRAPTASTPRASARCCAPPASTTRSSPSTTGTIALAVDALPAAVAELPVLGGDQLTLKTTLGRGGMGVVRLGDQRALTREVAVKCAVPGATDRHHAATSLVQEAWAKLLAARPSASHDIERHVGILMQVCRAVHFAHP